MWYSLTTSNLTKVATVSFQDQNLHQGILKAINDAGYKNPTPIQELVIPNILSGKDIRASAQTGTGKTAAFLLPALQRLTVPSPFKGTGPRVLVLVPTRELAMQVANEAVKYSKYLSKAKTVCIYGGAPYPIQNRQLSRPYEILVATPGRLIDHLERGKINFSRLEMLILDEADRMLDMGFIGPVEQIAEATPKERQTLMFSATLKGSVMSLSKKLLNNPIEIEAEHSQSHVDNIEQRLHQVDNLTHKNNLLEHLLIDPLINQAIIFTSTKRHAEELVGMLHEMGHSTAALHGDMNQRQRTRTILKLRQGEIKILVATDVAARGIDVQTISHVINFDMPMGTEDYVHRIGRTGRAGAKGIAISFASMKDMAQVKRIEQFTGQKMVPHVIPGFEPKSKEKSSDGKGSQRTRRRSGGERDRAKFSGRSERPKFAEKKETPRFVEKETPRFVEKNETPRFVEKNEKPRFAEKAGKPKFERKFEKPSFGARNEKSKFSERNEKPKFGERGEKPKFGGRSERPKFGERSEKPKFDEKNERPKFSSRNEKPKFGGKSEKPRFDAKFENSSPKNQEKKPFGGPRNSFSKPKSSRFANKGSQLNRKKP